MHERRWWRRGRGGTRSTQGLGLRSVPDPPAGAEVTSLGAGTHRRPNRDRAMVPIRVVIATPATMLGEILQYRFSHDGGFTVVAHGRTAAEAVHSAADADAV